MRGNRMLIHKKVACGLLGATMLLNQQYRVYGQPLPGDIVVEGVKVEFDATTGVPITIEGRTHVPLRLIAERLGYKTGWDALAGRVTVEDGNKHMSLQIGSPKATINGKQVYIDEREGVPVYSTTATLRNDRTYVPLRFVTENLGCEVNFENGITYITNKQEAEGPIDPWRYQGLLGQGMDVDWSKTEQGRKSYNKQAAQDFKAAGVSHVRIRVKDEADEELFKSLDQQIEDCLEVGLIPIIAYQADEFKNEPSEKNIKKVVKWWETVAERYKDVSHLLSFDLLIEATDALNKQPEKLNEIYERIVTAIRQTNPTRIIMISPRLRSDAAYLSELNIPTDYNGYLMAEWHFYASGPSKTNERKLWTIGTEEEKALINEKIDLALEWQQSTGIPTWVGAWMPGNYNDGNDYTIHEQVVFATYMSEQLIEAGIPFAVNSDTKFYDRETNEWVEEMLPVRTSIYKK